MKKLFILTITLVLSLSLVACRGGNSGKDQTSSGESSGTSSAETNKDKTKVGDALQFGAIKWQVLAIVDNKALLITDDLIGMRTWHDTNIEDNIAWADSDIRAYLNTEFYNSLPEDFKMRIVEVANQNPGSADYSSPTGDPETLDKVFLLSVNEAKQYFEAGVLNEATNNEHNWWLRSPGMDGGHAAGVGAGTDIIYAGGYAVTATGGVRPALWITLK